MNYRQIEADDLITLEPGTPATGCVIWLHGLGANGFDFVPAVEALQLPPTLALNFLFPHAELRPVSVNQGYIMRAWYDIRSFSARDEDEQGIRESEQRIRKLMSAQIEAGIPPHKIVIAGFSQGGAMALHLGLRYPERLAGILALSTYLPLSSMLEDELEHANRDTPILMCHGTYDSVVAHRFGEQSRDILQAAGCKVEWRSYPMAHEVRLEQLIHIGQWLATVLKSAGT